MNDLRTIQNPSALRDSLTLVSEGEETIRVTVPHRVGFSFHWLREVSLGAIQGDLGLPIAPAADACSELTLTGCFRRVISLDEQHWLRLKVSRRDDLEFPFASRIAVAAQVRNPLPGRPDELAAAILGMHSGKRLAHTSDSGALREAVRLKDSIFQKSITALERKLAAEAASLYQSATADSPLLDCAFDFSEEGLRAYRQALAGDYSQVLSGGDGHIRLHPGALFHSLAREIVLELHLPFFGRKEWPNRLGAMAAMEVESEDDGRLFVYHGNAPDRTVGKNAYHSTLALAGALSVDGAQAGSSFTLGYSDRRRLSGSRAGTALAPVLAGCGFDEKVEQWLDRAAASSPCEEVQASLSLSLPGSLAAAWLDAPGEHSPSFFPVYSQVSLAVQRAMRRWLPFVYFEDLDRYDTLKTAFPLVIYQASRPFTPKPRTEFTYDVLNDRHMSMFFESAVRGLRRELTRISRLLNAAGRTETASLYHPLQADDVLSDARRRRGLLNSLLVADTFFVDALINLGCQACRLRRETRSSPRGAVRNLSKIAARLVKAFHSKLRRHYGGMNFLPLGSLLLVEATNALNPRPDAGTAIQAVLRVTRGSGGDEQVLVNPAYRP